MQEAAELIHYGNASHRVRLDYRVQKGNKGNMRVEKQAGTR